MPKPEEYPDWATAPADPDASIVAPPPSRVAEGWAPSQRPPAQNFNWWKNLVGKWIRWIDEWVTALEARMDLAVLPPRIGFRGIDSTAEGVGSSHGVRGVGNGNGFGIYGISGTGTSAGVRGEGLSGTTNPGVLGVGAGGASGVVGMADGSGHGVQGVGGSSNASGVRGYGGTSGGYGVVAEAGDGNVRAALHVVPQTAEPSSPETGAIYFDLNTSKLRVYDGTAWVDLH